MVGLAAQVGGHFAQVLGVNRTFASKGAHAVRIVGRIARAGQGDTLTLWNRHNE
jgi:hypothetical protein